MTTTMNWLESHVGSLDKGVELARRLFWPLHVERETNKWFVMSAEQVILSSDSEEVVNAFLYGMGLAYAGIPDDIFDDVAKKLAARGFAG